MKLYLLRHAEAHPIGYRGCRRDFDRPLTPKGRKTTLEVANGLRVLGIELDAIWTSPAVRALQTAEIVAAQLNPRGPLQRVDELAPNAALASLIARLRREPLGQDGSVMLVGHEPALSELVSRLVRGDAQVALEFKKTGLCRLEVGELVLGRCGVLEWLLPPKLLARLGASA